MKRVDVDDLLTQKEELFRAWKITEQDWKEFIRLVSENMTQTGYYSNHSISSYLRKINHAIRGFGVEYVENNGKSFEYINMGDAYALTAIFNYSDACLYIGRWADIFED